MKPTFLNYEKPFLTAMIQCPTPDECIQKIRASIAEGADALGVQLCKLRREYRTAEYLRAIFAACEGKPIYVTSYRFGESQGMTDEECADLLLLGLDCGGTLCDVMGNMFDPACTHHELTRDPVAVQKQKDLIDEIHRRGGEVLMSSHTNAVLTPEEALALAKEHVRRGADITKQVNLTESESELPDCIHTVELLKAEAGAPFLYLLHGPCYPYLRQLGILFGVCMCLCVQEHGPLDTPQQPLLRKAKAIRDDYTA